MTRKSFLLSSFAFGLGSLLPRRVFAADGAPVFDENLSVFLSDIHVNGLDCYPKSDKKIKPCMRDRFAEVVNEILAMNPRPRHVFVFGDIAYLNGRAVDYAKSKPGFQKLIDGGIKLTLGLGNHDHTAAFLDAWPEYRERTVIQDQIVTVTELPGLDFIMLDSHNENGKAESRNESKGHLPIEQAQWIKEKLQTWKRPFILGAHHSLFCMNVPYEKGGTAPLAEFLRAACPKFRGFIHGHDHIWKRNFTVWTDPKARPMLTLPSNGCWGDIGYTLFRSESKKAVATLVQKDFYLHDPVAPGKSRPAAWAARLDDNKGEKCTFVL